MSELTERRARMGLAAIALPNDVGIELSLKTRGPQGTWQWLLDDSSQNLASRRAKDIDIDEVEAETGFADARFIIPGDPEWPASLADLDGQRVDGTGGVPFGLWIRGLGLDPQAPVTVTGSRAATDYGRHVAEQMAADLADRGHTVVSGVAFGIDHAALLGAMSTEGAAPVAVLASGLHLAGGGSLHQLVEDLSDRGTLVTELPPTAPTSRAAVLSRSRVLAALGHATVVAEGLSRSSANSTARWAHHLGRIVCAVPGPATCETSAAPHNLIRSGMARLVTCAEHVVEELDASTIADDQFCSSPATTTEGGSR